MCQTNKKQDQFPESYRPQRPEIINMMENAVQGSEDRALPAEYLLKPKDKIAEFNGEKWPFSNVEPAVYGALGLFCGRMEQRDEAGALVNSDLEYSVQNVLTGYAFGLFYCAPDPALGLACYGLASNTLDINGCSEDVLTALVKEQIFHGNVVLIRKPKLPRSYLIFGYRENGALLLGCEFEDGNDNMNCSYDLEAPLAFSAWTGDIGSISVVQRSGQRLDRDSLYRQALAEGCRMLAQERANPELDVNRVHFGYGQALYDAWVARLTEANSANSEEFYFASPVFPHFIALYENRLHLCKFLKMYGEQRGDENLLAAAKTCEKLKDAAAEAIPIGFTGDTIDPKILAMTNNERRTLLINILQQCRSYELELVEQLGPFFGSAQGYHPYRPEIVVEMEKARAFTLHESGNFSYRFDAIQLSEGLKFAGCANTGAYLSELKAWQQFDQASIQDRILPMTGIRLWHGGQNQDGDWIRGCLVSAVDNLPAGVVGVDTGWKEFLVLTIRRDTVNDIFDKEDHYLWAHNESWPLLPLNGRQLSPNAPGADKGFCTKDNGSTSLIEIYPAGLNEGIPEVCFYYPLKED